MSDASPIEIRGLSKVFGSFVAVDDLDLSIKKNSFTGFLGPNGAGKSTTLKILTNLSKATSGEVFLNGINVAENPKEALHGVGTVVETPEFYDYLTPIETFRYIGEVIGMSPEAIKAQTVEILDKMKMTEWGDKRIGTFSKGMRQRIALGQALLNDPEIIILDEPTSGLDPRGTAEMRQILSTLRAGKENLTILMSSHMLHEVSDLCDRVAMINHGKLLVHDDMDKVIFDDGVRKIVVKTHGDRAEAVKRIGATAHVLSVNALDNEIRVELQGDRVTQAEFMKTLANMDIGIYSVSQSTNTLEQKYLEMIKESR
ncbi:MAG: ABC transporter ATP-binding protein [Thermoplasmatales archaeon]|nr:ABC transporter ATP-binding protein [Thermoplasmatales archaeon]